jgi:serine protease Do
VSVLSPGAAAKIELWRKGKTKTISMNVGEMKVASAQGKASERDKVYLGLSVRPLSPEERRQADVQGGLLVENVSDGPAGRAGVRPGDVILSVNGEQTGSIEKLRTLVGKSGKHVALLIMRGEQQMFVPIYPG